MFREGIVCELCLTKTIPLPGIRYSCYRNSRIQTSIVATMLTLHRILKTWETKIDAYIALSNIAKKLITQGGISPQKIFVKPNFVSDPGKQKKNKGNFAIYVGRLSQEKGILSLVNSWVHTQNTTLRIIGDGPLRNEIQKLIKLHGSNNIELIGWIPYSQVLEQILLASFLIFPTKWNETFGRVVIEAFSCGIPVVASRIGAVEELVTEGETGLLFNPYDTEDMIAKISWMNSHPKYVRKMGEYARKQYESFYTPEVNYQKLMDIYEFAMKSI
jgi:glycosyltransferase involved in cell wall biosynthesis